MTDTNNTNATFSHRALKAWAELDALASELALQWKRNEARHD